MERDAALGHKAEELVVRVSQGGLEQLSLGRLHGGLQVHRLHRLVDLSTVKQRRVSEVEALLLHEGGIG